MSKQINDGGPAFPLELNAANAKIKELEEWKRSALEVEREWNANAIATMLGGKLGESHRKVIQREVLKLLARIKRLEEFARTIANDFDHDDDAHRYGTVCRVCYAEDLLKETKSKEAKP